MSALFIVKKNIIKMSLHLETVFALNIFALQAFLYVPDNCLEIIVYCKFSILLEA